MGHTYLLLSDGTKKKVQFWEKRVLECRHFSGILNKMCKAGVFYKTVCDSSQKPFRWPCLNWQRATTVCDKISLWTKEEAKKFEEEIAKSTENYLVARARIMEHAAFSLFEKNISKEEINETERKQLWGRAGYFKCPICQKANLSYHISETNGHIHASCGTKNCVRFME